MTQPPLPPARRSWFRRHKRLVTVLLSLATALLIVFVAALLYIRSGRLNKLIANQIQIALADYGVRSEIGGFDISWGPRTARIRDVKLYNQQTGELIATLDAATVAVEIPSPFALSLRRTIIFKRIDLTGLNVYVAIDDKGQPNWRGLHQPPPSGPSQITFDFSGLVGSIDGGAVNVDDAVNKIKGQLKDLRADAHPVPGAVVDIHFVAGSGNLSYQKQPAAISGLDVTGRLGDSGAEIQQMSLHSSLGNIALSGKVDDWSRLQYNFNVKIEAVLNEVSRVFSPSTDVSGTANFDGRVDGQGAKFKITGNLKSDDIKEERGAIREVKAATADGVSVDYDKKRIGFSVKQVRVSDIIADGERLSDISAGNLNGEIVGERFGAKLAVLTVSKENGSDHTVNGIKLSGVDATIENERYHLTADLGISGGAVSKAAVGPATAKLELKDGQVALNQFQAAIFGGAAKGSAVISTAKNAASSLTAAFSSLKTEELLKLTGSSNAPVAGQVGGQATVTWPGTDFASLNGSISAQIAAQTTQTKNAIPISGQASVKAASGNFNVENLTLSTDNTHVTASGTLTKKGDSNLQLSVNSNKAEELQTIAYSLDDVEKNLSDYQPHLAGQFTFKGRVTGSISDPGIEGDLNATSIGLRDQTLGSLSGHLLYSPSEVAFQNGVLAATDGGSAKFSYSVPRDQISTAGKLDATIDKINLSTILAAAGASLKESTASGLVSGQAHLTNLPESPTGSVVINMVNATLLGEAAQSAVFNVTMDGHTARIDRADMRLAQGDLTASGTLDFKSDAFQAQGRADNINLSKLAESFGSTDLKLTGSANATFQATGNTKDIGDLKLELTAQGQGITVNDHDAGQLNLTARTNPGGRIDVSLVTGIAGKPTTVAGSIELRQPGRPVTVHSEFTDLDLGPLLADFAPDAASDIKGAISGRLQVSGPIVNDKDEFTPDGLRGNLTLTAITSELQDRKITIQTPLNVALGSRELTLSQTHITGDGIDLNLGGRLGLAEGAGMGFTLTGTANLGNLAQLGPDVSLGGKVTINARLEGTFTDPRLAGDASLTELEYTGLDIPIQIENGSGHIALAGDKITLDKFSAQANDGTLDAGGSLSLSKLRPKDWDFKATARNVDVYYLGADGIVDGDLTLRGPSDNVVLGGTINVPSAEYATNFNLDNLTAGGGGSLSIGGGGAGGPSPFDDVNLNVKISAPGTLLVRNQQINTVGTAALTVGGTIGDPSITGRVALEGGTIKFQSARYDITTGTLDFPQGSDTPVVNLVAEGDVAGYHVTVGLRGPTDEMEVTLRSDPDLQRSDILSLIATGKVGSNSLGEQSMMESGLGTAGSLLSQGLISQPAQSLLGLNRFAVDPVLQPNSNPAARITVGKQLTKDFSFTYSSNLASQQDQSVLLEYTVTNRLSAIVSYTEGGTVINGASTDTNFSIEVRMRKRFSLGYGENASGTPGPAPVVKRPELPHADVELENITGVKLSGAKLKELLPVKEEGFNRALARLGERNLENYLQEQGYFKATVNERCDPADCSGSEPHVIYDVQLGQRYRLTEIRIEGTDVISYSDVSDELQSQEASFVGAIPVLKSLPFIGGLARGITSHDRVRRDRDAIKNHLADMGYRSSRVDSHFDHGKTPGEIALVFKVDPGPKSTVSKITFTENQALTSDQLLARISLKEGEPFSPTKLKEAVHEIKKSYADLGYLEANSHYTITDTAPNVVSVEYDIDEGSQAKVAEIAVTGQTKTREDSIRRYFAFHTGDILTQRKIRDTQRDLFASGAFSEVNIHNEQVSQDDPTARKVTVQVTEMAPLLFVYGPGYSTDNGAEGLAQLTHTNIFGRANSASIRLRISQREQLGQIQYTDLRPFGSRWALTFSTFYDRSTNLHTVVQQGLVGGGTTTTSGPAFGIDRFSTYVQTERKLTEKASIHFRYNFETVKLINPQNIPVLEIARNEQSIKLGEFSLGFTRDTRDSAVNPTKGQLFSLEHTVASSSLGGSVSFNKFFANYQHYYALKESTPVLKDTVLAFSARLGLAAPFQVKSSAGNGVLSLVDRQLPISERFFAGGTTTLRGFGFDQAGPQAVLEPQSSNLLPTLVPIGGDALMIYNFELRYPLTRKLRLVPFYDLGNVFPLISDINWQGMTHTVGLGLRFNTPLGPVGIDYGYLLNPPSFVTASGGVLRQPHGAFHFRFGQTF